MNIRVVCYVTSITLKNFKSYKILISIRKMKYSNSFDVLQESIREAFSTIQKLDSVYSSSLLALVQQYKKALVQNIQENKLKRVILQNMTKTNDLITFKLKRPIFVSI